MELPNAFNGDDNLSILIEFFYAFEHYDYR